MQPARAGRFFRRRNPPLELSAPPRVVAAGELDGGETAVGVDRSVAPRGNQQPHNVRPLPSLPTRATPCNPVEGSFPAAVDAPHVSTQAQQLRNTLHMIEVRGEHQRRVALIVHHVDPGTAGHP